MSEDPVYCDGCAVVLTDTECVKESHKSPGPRCTRMQHWISELPVSVDSANDGESAVLCGPCFKDVDARAKKLGIVDWA